MVSELLRRIDDGFDGRGFSVREILAGFLRRVRREGRSTVLVLDDLTVGGPDLAPVLAALTAPDRFLPEGESGLPPIWTIVAGSREALETLDRALAGGVSISPFVRLDPYSPEALRAIVRARAERALGHPLAEECVAAIVRRAVEEGGGSRRAIDLLRQRLLGASLAAPFGSPRSRSPLGIPIESRVVRAIGAASHGIAAPVGAVKRLEAELARSQGDRPLPTTTLWRRIVRLEQAGYVRREIRPGGNGGTRSLLRVLTPIDEWVTTRRPSDTPRAFGPWPDGTRSWAEDPGEAPVPSAGFLPSDGAPD